MKVDVCIEIFYKVTVLSYQILLSTYKIKYQKE